MTKHIISAKDLSDVLDHQRAYFGLKEELIKNTISNGTRMRQLSTGVNAVRNGVNSLVQKIIVDKNGVQKKIMGLADDVKASKAVGHAVKGATAAARAANSTPGRVILGGVLVGGGTVAAGKAAQKAGYLPTDAENQRAAKAAGMSYDDMMMARATKVYQQNKAKNNR